MLHELDLPTLQSRRKENRLCFMYKISKGLVPAIPATDHLTREVDKRQRKENPKYKDYETTNYVTKHQRLNNNCYKTISGETTVYKNSFPTTIFSDIRIRSGKSSANISPHHCQWRRSHCSSVVYQGSRPQDQCWRWGLREENAAQTPGYQL